MTTRKTYDASTGVWNTDAAFADPIPIANGGTGQITAALARAALGAGVGDMLYSADRFYVKVFTRALNAGSGNVNYTGATFTPKFALFFQADDLYSGSWGFDDGTNRGCILQYRSNNDTIGDSSPIVFYDTGGTKYMKGYVSAWISGGMTITWISGNSPTGQDMAIKSILFA